MKKYLLSLALFALVIVPVTSSAQATGVGGLGSTISGSAPACPLINQTLNLASRGSSVSSLQQYLISQGYLQSNSLTGYFTPWPDRLFAIGNEPIILRLSMASSDRNQSNNCPGFVAVSIILISPSTPSPDRIHWMSVKQGLGQLMPPARTEPIWLIRLTGVIALLTAL